MNRHVMHNNYDLIKQALSFEGVKNIADVDTLESCGKNEYIDSNKYQWVKFVYEKLAENSVAAQTELAVWKHNPGQYFRINGLNYSNRDELSKFSCFFPGRTIVSAGDIKKNQDTYYIQKNALYNFFLSETISENDLGLYTPNSLNGRTLKSIISSSNNKYKIADLDKITEGKDWTSEKKPIVDFLYVGIPWLYNARIQDYIELVNRYENEFENFNRYINELAMTATSEYELTRRLVKDFNDLKVELNIKLDQKKEELRKKGISTLVGVCFTAIPYVINLKYNYVDPDLLSALIGGKTIWDIAEIITEKLTDNNIPKNNPLWIIWKWSQNEML